jgi:hypothetical protein
VRGIGANPAQTLHTRGCRVEHMVEMGGVGAV